MNSDRTLKKIFNTKPDGARSGGRLKLRWEDGVVEDMRILGVKNWKKSPSTQTKGQSFLEKPGPTRGCRDNDDNDDDHFPNVFHICLRCLRFFPRLTFTSFFYIAFNNVF
jgi:hypothetical protein